MVRDLYGYKKQTLNLFFERGGKLSNTILLPEINNQQIELIGGAGKEYWVDGKN